ncbi:MAG: hypothetical protein JRJ09_09535 [Deltaproteobacteria bacterium]|nr:hypothetical protein [Deltaproteobacteria bacterium]MBW2353138.1 hypothetical protein [Deltaproteobacteria bacterium]
MKMVSNSSLLKMLIAGFMGIILGLALAGLDKRNVTHQRLAAMESKIKAIEQFCEKR